MKLLFSFTFFFLISVSSYAHELNSPLCDKELSNVEITNCLYNMAQDLEKQVEEQENKKVEEYKEYLENWNSSLADSTPLVEDLIQSSKDFKQYMESECQYQKTKVLTGSAGGINYAGCKVNLLKLRLEFLKGF